MWFSAMVPKTTLYILLRPQPMGTFAPLPLPETLLQSYFIRDVVVS